MSPIPPRRLILCADDYGASDAIDAGIVDLIERGRVTATACLVHSPRWPEAAQRLRALPPHSAALGLHLDLTEFGASARPWRNVLFKSLRHGFDRAALRADIEAQCARFEDALGRTPDYVDGHQHVHQLPQVRQALLDVLGARGLKPWLRISRPPWQPFERGGLKRTLVHWPGAHALSARAARLGLPTTDRLLGLYDLAGDDSLYLRLLTRWLRQIEERSALVCHPAARLDGADPLGHARHTEYCVLAGAAFGHLLSSGRIALATGPHDEAGQRI